MGQIRTLKDVDTGEIVYPITSSKAVFNEKGEDIDTMLAECARRQNEIEGLIARLEERMAAIEEKRTLLLE